MHLRRSISTSLAILQLLNVITRLALRKFNVSWPKYPDDPVPDPDEALALRNARRLRALGVARARFTDQGGEPHHVGQAGEPAVVEGVKGEWRVEPTLLDRPFRGRAARLSPDDRLVQDRKPLDQLFEFDYLLEMYKPVAQRKWRCELGTG